ncbi:hypothetical protein BC834DRAFT_101230 [Gloeopeniophorella convolvens]|nr:hypothetical protein BC834DRAFT_101230 [Gloeopeniophorella convolvens]
MPSLIPVDNLLGAFFIGVSLSSIVYGATWLQVYSYFTKHCQNDRLFLKSFVGALLLLDTLHLVLVIHGYYIVGVTNFGDFLADLKAPWSLQVQSLIGIILAACIQQFYAWRIYRLSMGKIYMPALIVVISYAELTLGIVYLVQCFRFPLYTQATVQVPISISGLSMEVACDVVITASMVYYLLTSRTKVKRTHSALTTLAVYSVNSGALTLVFAISCLSTFARYSRTLIYAPFFFVLVRLYTCAFMAILNSRDHIRTTLDAGHGTMVTISQFTPAPRPSKSGTASVTDVDSHAQPSFGPSTIDIVPQKMSFLHFAADEESSTGTVDVELARIGPNGKYGEV